MSAADYGFEVRNTYPVIPAHGIYLSWGVRQNQDAKRSPKSFRHQEFYGPSGRRKRIELHARRPPAAAQGARTEEEEEVCSGERGHPLGGPVATQVGGPRRQKKEVNDPGRPPGRVAHNTPSTLGPRVKISELNEGGRDEAERRRASPWGSSQNRGAEAVPAGHRDGDET